MSSQKNYPATSISIRNLWGPDNDATRIATNDGDGSYEYLSGGSGNYFYATVTGKTLNATSVNKLTLSMTAKAIDTGTKVQGLFCCQNPFTGNEFGIPQSSPGTSGYTTYTQDWLTNPETGAAWAVAAFTEAGANNLMRYIAWGQGGSTSERLRVTQLIGIVDVEGLVAPGNPIYAFRQQ
jgi:hypothetical protein